jgi:tetratricopeptide (TPR) repeat protein
MNLNKLCLKISLSLCFIGFGNNIYSQTSTKIISAKDSIVAFNHFKKGYSLFTKKDFKNAKYELDTAILLDDRRSDGYYIRALSLENLKKDDLALLDYKIAIKLNSKKYGYYISRSAIFIRMKDYNAALSDLETAKKIDSFQPELHKSYGRIYKEQGDNKTALIYFNRAIQLNGKDPSFYWQRAETYFNLLQDSLALIDIEKGISLKPEVIDAYYLLAVKITLRLQKNEQLVSYATKYLTIKPNDCFVELCLGQAYAYLDKYQDAITAFNHVETQCKGNKELHKMYYFRAKSKIALNDFKGAGEDIETGIKLIPSTTPDYIYGFYDLRIEVYMHFGKYKEAKNDADAILKQMPNQLKAIIALGTMELKNNNYANAIDYFNKALSIEPELAVAYVERGDAENSLKDYEGAQKDFLKSLSMKDNPLRDRAYKGVIENFERVLDFEKAFSYVNQAIEEYPNDSDFYLTRGKLFVVAKNNNGACADFKMAKQLGNAEATRLYKNGCK